MQDRYTGDVGDFGKYGLLRALCLRDGDPTLTLGVVWYLVPNESHTDDGKHTKYLESSAHSQSLQGCDPDLYRALRDIVRGGHRAVSAVRRKGVLPATTRFFEEPLTFQGMPGVGYAARTRRLTHRARWLRGALEATVECNAVFLDPDNGLEVLTKPHQKYGPKYVYFDDLSAFRDRGQTLVVYHHIGRTGSSVSQVRGRSAEIKERLDCSAVLSLLYHRGTCRVFFVIPAEEHVYMLRERVGEFMHSRWASEGHFEMVAT